MGKIIPLHSLVFCDDVANSARFVAHEKTGLDDIRRQLIGDTRCRGFDHDLYDELRHRVALKLSLGERTVISMRGLSSDRRRDLAAIAFDDGAAVFTLGRADGSAGVVVPAATEVTPVSPLPCAVLAHLREQDWHGVTVIGDVHGELQPLQRALAWARSRQHFIWFLGDIVDYGRHTLETVELVYQAVMHGEAAMVAANHERKIFRWLNRDSEYLRVSDGNRVTIDALRRLPGAERQRWAGRFRALLSHTVMMSEIGDFVLLHAAAHPSLWAARDDNAIEQFALFGESDHANGRYKRTHCWVDAVPENKTVIVGHDVLSEYPMMITGSNGGKVIFLDTGCGKGGQLSSADLRFADEQLHLECFKRY